MHVKDCSCEICESQRGYKKARHIVAKEEEYEAHNKDLCPCEVCQRYRKQNPTAARAKAAADDNERKHLNHPFYKRVKNVVDEVEREQIIYGAGKYPEPFNPMSWTPKELLWHNLKELRDATVYSVGLFEQIEHMEKELKHYKTRSDLYEIEMNRVGKLNVFLHDNFKEGDPGDHVVDIAMNLLKKFLSAKEELEQHRDKLIQASYTFVKELGEKNKEIERLQEENKRLKKNIKFTPSINIPTSPIFAPKNIFDQVADAAKKIGQNIDKEV